MDHTDQNSPKIETERKVQKSPKNGPTTSKTGNMVPRTI